MFTKLDFDQRAQQPYTGSIWLLSKHSTPSPQSSQMGHTPTSSHWCTSTLQSSLLSGLAVLAAITTYSPSARTAGPSTCCTLINDDSVPPRLSNAKPNSAQHSEKLSGWIVLVEKLLHRTDRVHSNPWLSPLGSALQPGFKGPVDPGCPCFVPDWTWKGISAEHLDGSVVEIQSSSYSHPPELGLLRAKKKSSVTPVWGWINLVMFTCRTQIKCK